MEIPSSGKSTELCRTEWVQILAPPLPRCDFGQSTECLWACQVDMISGRLCAGSRRIERADVEKHAQSHAVSGVLGVSALSTFVQIFRKSSPRRPWTLKDKLGLIRWQRGGAYVHCHPQGPGLQLGISQPFSWGIQVPQQPPGDVSTVPSLQRRTEGPESSKSCHDLRVAKPGFNPGLSQHQACRGWAWRQLLWPEGGDCAKFLQLGDLSHISLSFLSFLKTWTICQKKDQSFSSGWSDSPIPGFQKHRFQTGSRTADFGRASPSPCPAPLRPVLRTEAGTARAGSTLQGLFFSPKPRVLQTQTRRPRLGSPLSVEVTDASLDEKQTFLTLKILLAGPPIKQPQARSASGNT